MHESNSAGSGTAQRWRTRHLPLIHYLVDVAVWAVALPLTTFSRYDFQFGPLTANALVRAIIVAALAQATFGIACGLYTRRWR